MPVSREMAGAKQNYNACSVQSLTRKKQLAPMTSVTSDHRFFCSAFGQQMLTLQP